MTSIHEDSDSIPGLTQWVIGSSVAASCSIGHKYGSDLALLSLWYKLAAAAHIQPLAWEISYAADVALKRKKKVIFLVPITWILQILSSWFPTRESFYQGVHST